MKVLVVLTYYRPHVSGLTIYVERLSQALVERGHEVTVLTSHYSPELPREEVLDGVRIVRAPVAFRLSKGVIMPTFGFYSTRLVKESDVISAHLPQFDAWGIALRGRLFGKPCVLTYHCDLELPGGALNRFIDQMTFAANYIAATASDKIVAYTQDYADHSRLVRRFKRKTVIIPPPVPLLEATADEVEAFKQAHGLEGRPVLGMAARFATEKGVEVLLDAAPQIEQQFPDYKILFAGPYRDIPGEEDYRARLFPRIEAMGDHWEFLGTLKPDEMPAFYSALDVLLVPSVNMTESFGLVQVEAMLCGTPVVASNLPGVRQPVRVTGMGEIIPIGDSAKLADSVTSILKDKTSYQKPRGEIESLFGMEQTIDSYERLFEEQRQSKRK